MIKGLYGIGLISLMVLAASLFVPLDPAVPDDATAALNRLGAGVPDAPHLETREQADYPAALLARPLFVRGRVAMTAASPPEQDSARPSQRRNTKLPALVGTLRRGDQLFAYFEGQGERGFRAGDKIAGWTIDDISEQGTSLVRGTAVRQLRLRPEAATEQNQGRKASGGPNDHDNFD